MSRLKIEYTRVGVVQIACHPAAVLGRAALEDPLFALDRIDSLTPEHGVPERFEERMRALRARVRDTYCRQWLLKATAIVTQCAQWNTRLLVFPEYSVPWQTLEALAAIAPDMVIVAGTHTVDRAARASGVYDRLGRSSPRLGEAVCPVLHGGRLIGLQAKLNPAVPERGHMRAGEAWEPVALPKTIPGPMGVLVCLDFLFREGSRYRELVQKELANSRFLVVPSLTPHYTLPEFQGHAWEEARRYRRPVLYSDTSEGGGSTLFVDEGKPYDLRRFPDHPGYLERGDEGVVIADVDLGYERRGDSTRYNETRPVEPFAEASLVYRARPADDEYARWLDAQGELVTRDDDAAVDSLVQRIGDARTLLLRAASLAGDESSRTRRLRRLLRECESFTAMEQAHRYMREVVLPEEAVPLATMRAAMARGASDTMFEWMKESRAGLQEVVAALHEAGKVVEKLDPLAWTDAGRGAVRAITESVSGSSPAPKVVAAPAVVERASIPTGTDLCALAPFERDGMRFMFARNLAELRHVAPMGRVESEGRASLFEAVFVPAMLHAVVGDAMLLDVAEGRKAGALLMVTSASERWSTVVYLTCVVDEWQVIALARDGRWVDVHERVLGALEASGFPGVRAAIVTHEEVAARVEPLRERFEGAKAMISQERALRLREVDGAFVAPDVRSTNDLSPRNALVALDAWHGEPTSTRSALLLGDFGAGKSTLLATWCGRVWDESRAPRPILCNLARIDAALDPDAMLLASAALEDTPANRAALRLLLRYNRLMACFDGFDEMATRVTSAELVGRLRALLDLPGRVLLSSRTHYFANRSALDEAAGSAVTRWEVLPFTREKVTELVRARCGGAAEAVLQRIHTTYDLDDLVQRPLLLAMVLASLDRLRVGARVAQADVYEAYLDRWLEQTHSGAPECFTDAQKKVFAEALAEELWRTGATSCGWRALQQSVVARMMQSLPDDMPKEAAFYEMQGGAFFVWEGDDSYRFAHKSFLEYFFARGLVRTLVERPREALDTRPFTTEVCAFLGDLLKHDPAAPAVRAVQTWLVEGRSQGVRVDEANAAANGLRLLRELSRAAPSGEGWFPENARAGASNTLEFRGAPGERRA